MRLGGPSWHRMRRSWWGRRCIGAPAMDDRSASGTLAHSYQRASVELLDNHPGLLVRCRLPLKRTNDEKAASHSQ